MKRLKQHNKEQKPEEKKQEEQKPKFYLG